MYKAYKFRLYPNNNQLELINKFFGCNRFVYNYYLDKIKKDKYMSAITCIKDYTNKLKYEFPFLQEVDSILIRKSLFNLEDSFKRYYNNDFGYPKYRSKYDKNSYATNAIYGSYKGHNYSNIKVDLENRLIKLPKLGKVKIRGYRSTKEIKGRIINATISREKNNKYYVSVVYEIPNIKNIIPSSIVGIDIGIKKLITLSDSNTYENNKYIEKYEKRIKRVQRELTRKKKGSNNYYKCKKKLNILYIKLSNARKYYTHKITKEITDNYDIIACETLNTKKMIMNKENHLSKNINDASFSEILRQLEYKVKEKGKFFYKIDPYYPSSQTCSVCDNIDKKYKNIKERTYKCKWCRNTLDRDLNASINIMFEGLKLYMSEKYI